MQHQVARMAAAEGPVHVVIVSLDDVVDVARRRVDAAGLLETAEAAERGDLDYYMNASYLMGLGDFQISELNSIETAVFIVATLINTIVMMNLLISILADTFDRVQQGLVQADRKSVCEMLIEVEMLLLRTKRPAVQTFFTVCSPPDDTLGENVWEGKIKIILDSVAVTRKAVNEVKSANQKQLNDIQRQLRQLQDLIEAKG